MLQSTEEKIKTLKNHIENLLEKSKTFKKSDLSNDVGFSPIELDNLLKSFVSKEFISSKSETKVKLILTKEGACYVDIGTPEYLLVEYMQKKKKVWTKEKILEIDKELILSELNEFKGKKEKIENYFNINRAFSHACKRKFLERERKDGKVFWKCSLKDDLIRTHLKNLDTLYEEEMIKALTKRKLITKLKDTTIFYEKGRHFDKFKSKSIGHLDISVLKLDESQLEQLEITQVNLFAKGKPSLTSGSLHPLARLRAQFRSIFLEMGFEEMDTSTYVEKAFWNFDAMFIPQNHPARDLQDTFYLDNLKLKQPPVPLPTETDKKSVIKEHEKAYLKDFVEEESERILLRTHTTAVSARMLRTVAKRIETARKNGEEFRGAKLFSIDTVFRNESVDATHLAEFQQIEGVVAIKGANLSNLVALLKTFFERIGIEKLKFKVAFNPYTEPSVEVFGFSKQLKKYVEIGNSGVFRREVLNPAGIPEEIDVIAWGLSLERPAMMMYGLSDIRDLCGNLKFSKNSRWFLF